MIDRRDELGSEVLHAGEERLRDLFRAAAVGIVLADPDGVVLFVNDYALDVLAVDSDGRTTDDLFHAAPADDRAQLMSMVRAAREGRSDSLRHRVLHADGSERWIDHSIAPFRTADSTVNGHVSTIADVTAEHAARVELQEQRDFTQAILDSVATLVVVGDDQGRIVQFNRACESVSGFAADDVIGRAIFDTLIPPDEREAVEGAFADMIEQGSTALETHWLTSDGGRRRISWTGTSLNGPDGSFRAFVGAGTDVTERRLLEARLAQRDRLESIGRLTTGITHDINNSLTLLQLRIDRIGSRHADDADTGRDLESLTRTVDRTKDLISSLLAFGRRQDLNPEAVDITAEAATVREMLSDLVGPDVVVELHVSPDRPVAFIDPARFDQILTNLAVNARDAMTGPGALLVTVDLETVDAGTTGERRHQLTDGTYVRVTVSDTGVGIEQQDLPNVFDPYFTTKPHQQGTGLGLAIIYGIVVQSGGTITVDSRPGDGTTFTILLPQADPATYRPSSTRPARAERGTILIVEDDSGLSETLSEELGETGYRVLVAGDGSEAFTFLDTPIDLLLSDLHLPDLTGLEVAHRFDLRQTGVPVLFITGAAPAERQALVPDGAAVLIKPFTVIELLTAVETELRGDRDTARS